jgi:chromosome segregation ATPase
MAPRRSLAGTKWRDPRGGFDLLGDWFMIESIMYFAGGFLVASLLALALISSVHHRAVRLTRRRLQDSIPVSLNEIQADRDKLRAKFAMSTRRLEVTVEQLEAKVTGQLGEIARKSEAVAKLKAQLAEKDSITDELSAMLKSLTADGRDVDQARAAQAVAAEIHAMALAAKDSELARSALEISELTFANETQRVEIVMLKAQLEQFSERIEQLEGQAGEAAQRLFDERVTVSNMTKALQEKREADDVQRTERADNEFLRERIADIAAQVAHLSMNEAGTPIAPLVKEATTGVRSPGHDHAAKDAGPSGGSLAERIRKLETAMSRVSSSAS